MADPSGCPQAAKRSLGGGDSDVLNLPSTVSVYLDP